MKFKKTFPFSLSVFTGNPKALRKTLLWWFNRYTEFDPKNIKVFDIDNLNQPQKDIIANAKSHSINRKTLLQIVNAGPGTGKTTAANSLAYSLKDEGVLLISYTNESIRENYKRFFEFSEGKSVSGLKKYNDTLINLVTVDSLATRIVGDASDNNFDRLIQAASINIDPLKFVHPIRNRVYNHIVVDECQDIDDLRGNFILTFCKKVGIKTLTLFGDPRQKIRGNAGTWYSQLWEDTFDYSKNGHSVSTFEPIHRIGFNLSYRFTNSKMIELVNYVSSQRPTLHVELTSGIPLDKASETPIEIISLDTLCDKVFFEKFVSTCGSLCIIGPSIEADNKTTNIGKKIAACFREKGKKNCF